MNEMNLTPKQIAEQGRSIYERNLRSLLEPEHVGEFVVIDVTTGNYELDTDRLSASLRAMKTFPNGVRYGMRVGYRAVGSIGGGRQGRAE